MWLRVTTGRGLRLRTVVRSAPSGSRPRCPTGRQRPHKWWHSDTKPPVVRRRATGLGVGPTNQPAPIRRSARVSPPGPPGPVAPIVPTALQGPGTGTTLRPGWPGATGRRWFPAACTETTVPRCAARPPAPAWLPPVRSSPRRQRSPADSSRRPSSGSYPRADSGDRLLDRPAMTVPQRSASGTCQPPGGR